MKSHENTKEIEKSNDLVYPSVETAFQFVVPSYQMMASRFEAADTRLATLLTMVMTLTLAAPAVGRAMNPTISFSSDWFGVGVGLFGVAVVAGLVGRFTGVLTLPNPMIHYQKSLHHDTWTFKKNAIYFAGQHFTANRQSVQWKVGFALAVTILLALEIGAFVLWSSGR